MFERIEIHAFQAHDSLAIDFDERVTTIVGPSDVGKSAIMRAIRWLATDRPLGDAFIREGETTCSVRLCLDGKKLGKRKGQKTEYRIGNEVFKAWGTTGPPEPVLDLLNLAPINFQAQHDSPFWFSLSAGEVGRELNSIVDLSAIDDVLSGLAARIRSARSESEVVESRLSAATQEVNRYSDVPLLATSFSSLQDQEEECFHLRGEAEALSRAVKTLGEYEQRSDELQQVVAHGTKLVDLGEKQAQLEYDLRSLNEQIDRIYQHRKTVTRELPDLTELQGLLQQWEAKKKEQEQLAAMLAGHEYASQKVVEAISELDKARDVLKRETKGRCPICGNPMAE